MQGRSLNHIMNIEKELYCVVDRVLHSDTANKSWVVDGFLESWYLKAREKYEGKT
jgi:hypothetical protein